jgi:DNA-directed RNA polymerase subunit RPC12/RpoP
MKRELSRYWYCEECQQEFFVQGGSRSIVCPQCNESSSILISKRRCANCDAEFNLKETSIATGMSRIPGRDWEFSPMIQEQCPECGGTELISLPEKR